MSNRTKTIFKTFLDYLLCLALQLFGLFILSWTLEYAWGYPTYSIIFTLLLFGMLYSRVHHVAERDLKRKVLKSAYEGLLLTAPLAMFNLIIILVFFLIQENIIPIRDIVIKTVYAFPDNEPRVATDILLIDYLTSAIRVWFSSLLGFAKDSTPAVLLLISPAVTLAAGFLGYFAGGRRFYLSEHMFKMQEKVKEKFNE